MIETVPPREKRPLVSVVICTQNRAHLLTSAIASVTSQDQPNAAHEIVVVDNGSTDDTKAVVNALATPSLNYVFEGEMGLSRARNAGWHAAKGQYVAYLDDDAEASLGWIDAIVAGFEHDREATAIGGPVRPVWHAPRPRWLEDEIAHSLTILDWGSEPRRLDLGREWLVGANIAFRREALAEAGGFHPWLGRQGGLLLSNEETFLLRQLEQRGGRSLYWPAMEICHPVPESRLDPRWFLQRYFWQGVSDAVVAVIEAGPTMVERRERAWARACRLPPPNAFARWAEDGAKFTQKCRAASEAGLIAGLLGATGR